MHCPNCGERADYDSANLTTTCRKCKSQFRVFYIGEVEE